MRPIISAISAKEMKEDQVKNWKYTIGELMGLSGGEARFLPLFWPVREDSVNLAVQMPVTRFVEEPLRYRAESGGRAASNDGQLFAPIYVYGDSFFDAAIRSGFLGFFSEYSRARIYAQDIVSSFSARPIGTKYMLLEFIETGTFGVDKNVTQLIEALESGSPL